MTSPQKMRFLTPLPPLSPFVTIFGLPPPSQVTGANGDKLFTRKMAREKINKTLCGNGHKLFFFMKKRL